MRAAAKALLVAATVVCLLSMGGAMMFAFPVLVPLHWLASRGSGPYGTGGWTFLAFASVFQGSWMLAYGVLGDGWAGFAVAVVVAVGTAVVFLRSAADRAAGLEVSGSTGTPVPSPSFFNFDSDFELPTVGTGCPESE